MKKYIERDEGRRAALVDPAAVDMVAIEAPAAGARRRLRQGIQEVGEPIQEPAPANFT